MKKIQFTKEQIEGIKNELFSTDKTLLEVHKWANHKYNINASYSTYYRIIRR